MAHTFFRANRQRETLKAHKALKAHTFFRTGTVPGWANTLYEGHGAVRTILMVVGFPRRHLRCLTGCGKRVHFRGQKKVGTGFSPYINQAKSFGL
jgi:hypothetical protein